MSHVTPNARRLSDVCVEQLCTVCFLVAPGCHYLSAVLIEPAVRMHSVFVFIVINVRNEETADEISFSTG